MLTPAEGNSKLVEYGIHNEGSDIRAHVCVLASRVYIFPTANALDCINEGNYEQRPVYTKVNGVRTVTAEGYLVPPGDIDDCEAIEIPGSWMKKIGFSENESTSVKGAKAVKIVSGLIKRGMFPFYLEGIEVGDYDLQVEGTDIIVSMQARIQVKCDYRGGPRWHGGTGNLFLQVSECNPLREY